MTSFKKKTQDLKHYLNESAVPIMYRTGHNQSLINYIYREREIMAYDRLKAEETRKTMYL